MDRRRVLVVGAGLAGSEVAWFLANRSISVVLVEGKTVKLNPSQHIPQFAELVCTNSLKSLKPDSSHGLLKMEMKALGSLVLEAAYQTQVGAGDALAVDRESFSTLITEKLRSHPLIEIVEDFVDNPITYAEKYQADAVVVATGPLTDSGLADWIRSHLSNDDFYFYDAIAPIVDANTLDHSILFSKDRYGESGEEADYLNAPFTKEEYQAFVQALVESSKVESKNFEDFKFFESCLPIDVMAERGPDTPRFSCMKPVGLEDPRTGQRPYAVVQLRKENLLGEAYNLVGLQTRLKYGDQLRVFRMIPGLEKAQFLRLGSVHRNSYLNAKNLLYPDLSSKKYPQLYFAGQITGVEGYTESAMTGLYVGHQLIRKFNNQAPYIWPSSTATGALVHYLMTNQKSGPSSIHFGLFPTPEREKFSGPRQQRRKWRRQKISDQAQRAMEKVLQDQVLQTI